MTITQIECFIETAVTHSFSKTAANLYISQQAVSRQIKSLETELGFPVFERHYLGVRLTDTGKIIYEGLAPALAQYHTTVDKATDFFNGEQKTIKIGLQDMGCCMDRIINALFRYSEHFPDLDIEYDVLPVRTLFQHLEEGLIHIMITYGSELALMPDLFSYPLGQRLQVGFFLSHYHPLARKKSLHIQDIAGETIGVLTRESSFGYSDQLKNALQQYDMLDKVELKEYRSRHNLQFALNTGKCITIMYNTVFEGTEDKLAFCPLQEYDNIFNIKIAWKNEKYAVKSKNLLPFF